MRSLIATVGLTILSVTSVAHATSIELGKRASDIHAVRPLTGRVLEIIGDEHNNETKVVLGFEMGCATRLGAVSFTAAGEGDTLTLAVSAFEEITKTSLVAICAQVVRLAEHTLTLPSYYAEENINVVFTSGQTVAVRADALRLSTVGAAQVELVDVGRLCPVDPAGGIACVLDGTYIKYTVTTTGCLDQAIPSHVAVEDGENLNLFVGALNVHTQGSQVVRCIAPHSETFTVSLIDQYIERENIILYVTAK